MKILFYVEPHPMRDSFTSHSQPYKIFLNICRQLKLEKNQEDFEDIDVRVFSNHVLQELRFTENLDMWPLILTPNSSEQGDIEEMATLWLPNGIKDWLDLSQNPEAIITKFYMGILDRIKREDFDFDVIVSWGQNQAVKTFAETNNIQTVYFELSSMRPPFPRALLMDPIGVNGAASSTYVDVADLHSFIDAPPVNVIFTALNDEFHQTKQNSNLFMSKFHPIDMPTFDSSKPVALIPLQLADDANLLLYSDFNSIEEFTEHAITLLSEEGWNILIKPHPHAYLRGGYVEHAQQKVIKKYENVNNVRIMHNEVLDGEYLSLLSNVDLIVTNNSSVGFEGLLCGTQCVTLGRSCYSLKNGLPTISEYLLSDDEAKAKYSTNASAIVTYMLSFMFPLERKIAHQLVSRIKLWKTLSPPPFGDSAQWVKQNLEQLGWSTWHDQNIAKTYFMKSDHEETSSSAITISELGNA